VRVILSVIMASALAGLLPAQNTIYGPGSHRGFQNARTGPQTIVRDSQGSLFVIYRYQLTTVNWDIAIARSTNNGVSWNMNWQSGFAYNVSSHYGNLYACLAIDSKDNLHCAWWHRGTTTSYETRYNRYDAASQSWGTEWNIGSSHLTVPCLAVDQNDYVWFSYCLSSYQATLDRSNLPCASDMKFTRYVPNFPGGGSSSSNPELIVDAANRIHMTYYDATASTSGGGAGVKHRWLDPAAPSPAWSAKVDLSYPPGHYARADYRSSMSADSAGNVYVIYTVDDQAPSSGRQGDTEFRIRKWDGITRTWGNSVLVHSVPYLVWDPGSAYNDGFVIASACDETTGELYFTYRDFTTGDFVLGRWRGDDTEAPTIHAKLMNTSPLPVATRNYFLYPHFRGSLWPRTNRTSLGLHLMYVAGDQTTAKVYTDYFEHFPVASMNSTGTPRIGTAYPLDLNGAAEGGKNYAAAVTLSGLMPMIPVGRRFIPLAADSLFFLSVTNVLPGIFVNFYGVLGPTGQGQATLAIPYAVPLVGARIDGCFVTYDAGGIRALSNPWKFMITK
jgi:hypothetical protein